jgi:nickel superoxide dismutase
MIGVDSRVRAALAAVLVATLAAPMAWGHCQIPCGIYGDDARLAEIDEHITTIEKGMKQIAELGAAKERNDNQIVRWVMNKEDHANQLSEIITFYFMAQRIKPAAPEDKAAHATYVERLTLLHRMQVAAMKAKQTTDLKHVQELRGLLDAFAKAYGSKWHRH